MLHHGAHFRWAFPGVVTTMIDAYLLRLDAELADLFRQAAKHPACKGVSGEELRARCGKLLVEQRMTRLRMLYVHRHGQTMASKPDH